MTDATLAQRCPGPARPAHSSQVLATRPPPDPPPRASTTFLREQAVCPGRAPSLGGWEHTALVPPFSLWASLLSPTAPLWLQARGSLLMVCAPTEEGDLPWPGLGGPAGLWLQIPVGQHLLGLKAPTPTAAHGIPERHVPVTFRGRAQQAEGGMVPPKDWRGGHWGVTA